MDIPENIRKYLGTDELEIQETDFGAIVRKPIYMPSKGLKRMSVAEHPLTFDDGEVLDEHVLIMRGEVPEREYPEVVEEVIVNIGKTNIIYREGRIRDLIEPGRCRPTIFIGGGKKWGVNHGYEVKGGEGHLYIARTLFPDFRR